MYKSILLAIDLAHESSWVKAAPLAATLAKSFGAELHVVTVAPSPRNSMVAQYFPKDFEQNVVKKTSDELANLVAKILPGEAVKQHVVIGRVYRSIVETANAQGSDLIVLASHRPELQDVLIGPNADLVARHTKASVMIVRP